MSFHGFGEPDEDTARVKISPAQVSAQEQIRQISGRVNELIETLRTQRDLLRQRGMSLPSGALDSLKTLRDGLTRVSNQLGSAMIELGQLRALAYTAGLINSSLDTDAVLNQVIDTVIQLTGAERGYIVLKNPDTGAMEYRVARGMDREQLNRSEFTVSRTVVDEVASRGEAVLTDNASKDPRFAEQQSIAGLQLRSILAVPLKVRGDIIGVVYCDNRIIAGVFKQHELNLLTAFANQAAVALENARLFEELREQLDAATEARDLMNNIFASIASGVLTLDGEDVVQLCNAALERIMGRSAADVVGMRLDEALPDLNGAFTGHLAQVRAEGSRQRLSADPVLHGDQRHWNLLISPLRDADGGVAMVVDDLTDLRRRQSQLDSISVYLPEALIKNIRDVDELEMGGQEREISVLHCDVRGFTNFSEQYQLAPDILMEIINKYMELSSDAITFYEGIVDKYMGDAVTGLFNTPFNPMEDHAIKAVRAAWGMMKDLKALHEILPPEQRLFYGVGVHTGMAVLGNIGSRERKEFSALGEAMDIGKLLQENAEKGEVLISQATFERVNDFWVCEALPPRKTKDQVGFTTMYRVVSHKKVKRTGTLDLDSITI